jgi:predicted enzyme related to lactoylglutathione lyase
VASADEAASRAKSAGGTVLLDPFDVFDAGRMSLLQDPQGAVFAVWQAGQHIGYRLMNEPGTRIWNELLTTDPAGATQFYTRVLGVSSEKMPGPVDYTILNVGETGASGVMQILPEMGPIPPNWRVFFMVDDVDATANKGRSTGGVVLMAPQDIPGIGRFAVIQDPQGAVFGLFKPVPM